MFGKRNGWVEDNLAEQWITRTIDILFRMIIGQNSGLIDFIKNRYKLENQIVQFNQVIGDGTLWIALLTAVGELDWKRKLWIFR